MGVRLYNAATGRFLSVDPVYGGNANAYIYPNDPVNDSDVTGQCNVFNSCWSDLAHSIGKVARTVAKWTAKIAKHTYRWFKKHWRGVLQVAALAACVAVSDGACLGISEMVSLASDYNPHHVTQSMIDFGIDSIGNLIGYKAGKAFKKSLTSLHLTRAQMAVVNYHVGAYVWSVESVAHAGGSDCAHLGC